MWALDSERHGSLAPQWNMYSLKDGRDEPAKSANQPINRPIDPSNGGFRIVDLVTWFWGGWVEGLLCPAPAVAPAALNADSGSVLVAVLLYIGRVWGRKMLLVLPILPFNQSSSTIAGPIWWVGRRPGHGARLCDARAPDQSKRRPSVCLYTNGG